MKEIDYPKIQIIRVKEMHYPIIQVSRIKEMDYPIIQKSNIQGMYPIILVTKLLFFEGDILSHPLQ